MLSSIFSVKIRLFFLFYFALSFGITAQNGGLEWVKVYGRNSNLTGERPVSMALDTDGNIYNLGTFDGAVDFDPGPGVFILDTGSSFVTKGYVLKLDANGEFVWAIMTDSSQEGNQKDIQLDQDNNVYVTGVFKGIIDIDPGVNEFFVGSLDFPDDYSTFLYKLDSSGSFVWGTAFVNTADDPSSTNSVGTTDDGLLISSNEFLYLVGSFEGIVDFDPGPGVFERESSLDPGGTFYQGNAYVVQLNLDGTFVNANIIYDEEITNFRNVTEDSEGNILFVGFYFGEPDVDFGSDVYLLSDPGSGADIFILKNNSDGEFVWAKNLESVEGEVSIFYGSLLVNDANDVFLTGSFNSDFATFFDVDPGTGQFPLMSEGSYDCFVIKLTSDGNFIWARSFGNEVQQRLDCSVLDENGAIYNVGFFNNPLDFDPTNGEDIYTTDEETSGSVFVQRLSSEGLYDGTSVLQALPSSPVYSSSIRGFDVEYTQDGGVLVLGIYQKKIDFDPSLTQEFLLETDGGEDDAFVIKLSPIPFLNLNEVNQPLQAKLYPNPTTSSVTVKIPFSDNENLIIITDVVGKEVMRLEVNSTNSIQIPLNLNAGIYFIQVLIDDKSEVLKLLVN